MYKHTTAIIGLSAFLLVAPAVADHHKKGEQAASYAYEEVLYTDAREETDRARDEGRNPAAVLAIMGIGAGDSVIDIGAGSGYYSEIFARIVGADGIVHVINTQGTLDRFETTAAKLEERRAKPGVETLHPMTMEYDALPAGFQSDAAFMGMMYHEVIRQDMDAAAINAAVYGALKPGGMYVIEIHRAEEGSGRDVSEAYHRSDPAIVRNEVLAAGFELVEENTELLDNPDDPLNILVFDDSIRGKTARTVFFFRKPAE